MNERAYARAVEEADDVDLLRIVRGMNAVDRAVRRFHARGLLELKIPLAVAVKIGWPLCSSCGRPIVPWQVIRWRKGDWHPTCIKARLSEHGGRAAPVTAPAPCSPRDMHCPQCGADECAVLTGGNCIGRAA